MPDHTDLIDRYIAAWNETDGDSRRALITRTFAEDASYLDPHHQSCGAGEIDAMIGDVQQRLPGYRFHRAGNIEEHHDCVRFSWQAVPEAGPVFAGGTDIAVIVDGRFHKVTGFIDYLQPAQP